jgi:carnitine-CoA ligase
MHAAMARDRVSGAKSVVWAFNDHGKDEVLIAVSLAEGRTLDPVDLISFSQTAHGPFHGTALRSHLGGPTQNADQQDRKYLIRKDGVTPDTFDRDAVGIAI